MKRVELIICSFCVLLSAVFFSAANNDIVLASERISPAIEFTYEGDSYDEENLESLFAGDISYREEDEKRILCLNGFDGSLNNLSITVNDIDILEVNGDVIIKSSGDTFINENGFELKISDNSSLTLITENIESCLPYTGVRLDEDGVIVISDKYPYEIEYDDIDFNAYMCGEEDYVDTISFVNKKDYVSDIDTKVKSALSVNNLKKFDYKDMNDLSDIDVIDDFVYACKNGMIYNPSLYESVSFDGFNLYDTENVADYTVKMVDDETPDRLILELLFDESEYFRFIEPELIVCGNLTTDELYESDYSFIKGERYIDEDTNTKYVAYQIELFYEDIIKKDALYEYEDFSLVLNSGIHKIRINFTYNEEKTEPPVLTPVSEEDETPPIIRKAAPNTGVK